MNTKHSSYAKIHLLSLHFLILFLGLFWGILVAYWISLLPLTYGNDLATARELGIVSKTTLAGYSKTRDLVNYIALITLPISFAMLFWFIWVRRIDYKRLSNILEFQNCFSRPPNRRQLIVVYSSILLISFNINYFFKPIFDWSFPIEEGINLFSASIILSGGVQSLDFSSQYGPMLIYPLAMLMKFFGATILSDRIYTYILNLVAYGIVIFFFYKTIRSSTIFVVASLTYISVFSPFLAVSPNTSYLRVALGFLPILLIGSYFETNARRYLWICGLVAGQSLAFSQEVGCCSLIAVTIVLLINNLYRRSLYHFICEIITLWSAVLISISPILIYFAYKGALSSFLFELTYYPMLYSMGFGALEFPSIASLFTNQLKIQTFYPYWLIFIYLLAALWLLPQLIICKPRNSTLIPFSVTVMGLLLFRSALCRSDFYHCFFVAQPVLLLFFIMLDQAICRIRRTKSYTIQFSITVIIFLLYFLLPYISHQYRKIAIWDLAKQGFDVSSKFVLKMTDQQFMMNITGGVPIGDDLKESVLTIYNFLARNTDSGEYVYFYPNQAGYYFLFERKNPTRYGLSSDAVTTKQRLETIKDLETNKPKFVICSKEAYIIDNIPPHIQVPELHEYLFTKYSLYEDAGEILFMKRIDL